MAVCRFANLSVGSHLRVATSALTRHYREGRRVVPSQIPLSICFPSHCLSASLAQPGHHRSTELRSDIFISFPRQERDEIRHGFKQHIQSLTLLHSQPNGGRARIGCHISLVVNCNLHRIALCARFCCLRPSAGDILSPFPEG